MKIHYLLKKKILISFENLTIVAYESNLLCMRLISDEFLEFIYDYHKECYKMLSPLLKDDHVAMNNLKRKTEKILREATDR